jgi:hypothetical protein
VVLSEREREHLLLISSTSTYLPTNTIHSGVGGEISSPPLFADGVVGPCYLPSPAGMDRCRHPSRHPQNRYIYILAGSNQFVVHHSFNFLTCTYLLQLLLIYEQDWGGWGRRWARASTRMCTWCGRCSARLTRRLLGRVEPPGGPNATGPTLASVEASRTSHWVTADSHSQKPQLCCVVCVRFSVV